MEIITLQDIVKEYQMGRQSIRALDGVDLAIEKNEYVAFNGTLRIGEVDAYEYPWLSGRTNLQGTMN